MNHTRTLNLTCASLLRLAFPLGATERYFGEPVQLKGRALYFTSWKYLRQGTFSWRSHEIDLKFQRWFQCAGSAPVP